MQVMEKEKSIFKNTIYNALYNGLAVIFPLITVPYISRILLSDGIGKVNYATNIVSWFLLFASLGIPRYGVREIAKTRDDKKELSETFSELFIINFVSTAICSIIYLILVFVAPYFSSRTLLYLTVWIQLFLNIFNVDWFYQGLEEYGYITKRSFVVKLLSLIAIFVFVHKKEDYVIYAAIQSFALAGNYCWNMAHIFKYTRFSFHSLTFKRHISPIFILLSTQLAVNIYALLDTTMLGWWCSDSVIGYYSNAQKIIRVISVLTASLGGVMLPRLVSYIQSNRIDELKKLSENVLEVLLFTCVPISIGLFMLSDDIVLILFGKDFLPSITTMKIFAPFIVFTTIGNLYGTQLLMSFGEEKLLLKSVVVGACINFTLNFLSICRFVQNGAAFASAVTECIVMILQVYYVRRYLVLHVGKKNWRDLFVMNAAMIVCIIMVRFLISNTFLQLIIAIVVGICIYGFIGMILKNDIIYEILGYTKQLIHK